MKDERASRLGAAIERALVFIDEATATGNRYAPAAARELRAAWEAHARSESTSRERFEAAFLAACAKQEQTVAHTPGWKPLIDLVWEELQRG